VGSPQTAARGAGGIKKNRGADRSVRDTRIEQAEIRTERAEERTKQAKTRTEQAKTRTEQAETRTEQAETRTEQAETRTEQAETRTEQAETRTEQAETRTELAKTRTEQAEIRTEQAESRTELAELRTEQAETALKPVVSKAARLSTETPTLFLKKTPGLADADRKNPLEQLTSRQRATLQLIAEGQNTKRIAEILKVSPKTVEYHRMKLMDCLHIHDVPGLVRLAMQAGLLQQEKLAAG
jgi:DNA-binding CsgD family transcriptional regulator